MTLSEHIINIILAGGLILTPLGLFHIKQVLRRRCAAPCRVRK